MITARSTDYDNNTWFNIMTQQQADKVLKMRAANKRTAAALGQKQDGSDDYMAKNAGAHFGRGGKKKKGR